MADITYNQEQFSGINQQVDTSLISRDQYPLLINGRIRNKTIAPINKSKLLAGVPEGTNFQGIYAAANFLVIFVDGKAFWKNFNYPNSGFVEIAGVALNPDAPIIYTALVPESFVNYSRTSADGTASGAVTLTATAIQFSPQALICQDGISQPQLIFSNGTGRAAKNYNEWTMVDREYVPIGKQMLYYNGKLYIVSIDGNRIYHSVTGRPLDFMVIIDENGNKLSEDSGKADIVAHRVNFAQITAIHEVSSVDGAFLVCTERSSSLVKPILDELQFGEPLHANQFLFSTGAKNQFSVTDVLGDTAIIDFGGIKSFNSILQTKVEGKNSAFSAIISKLFVGVNQTTCCAANFDNYSLFAINSIYGSVVAVFDNINKVFVSFDQPGFTIKQFAEVLTDTTRTLFALTTDGEIYQMYGDTTAKETCSIYIGDFTSKNPRIEQKPRSLKCVFLNVIEAGTIYAIPFTDGKKGQSYKQDLVAQLAPENVPISIPFGNSSEDVVRTSFYEFSQLQQCWKFGILLQWNFNAELSFCQVACGQLDVASSLEQTATNRKAFIGLRPTIVSFPSVAHRSSVVNLIGKNFLNVTGVYLGNTPVSSFTIGTSTTLSFVVPVDMELGSFTIKLKTPTGFEYSGDPITIS